VKTLGALFMGWGIGLMTAPKQGDWGDLLFLIPFTIAFIFLGIDIIYDYKIKGVKKHANIHT